MHETHFCLIKVLMKLNLIYIISYANNTTSDVIVHNDFKKLMDLKKCHNFTKIRVINNGICTYKYSFSYFLLFHYATRLPILKTFTMLSMHHDITGCVVSKS